jgi:hypothetical protein
MSNVPFDRTTHGTNTGIMRQQSYEKNNGPPRPGKNANTYKARKKQKRTTMRVSITFKVGSGWKGTKSRDFPGRTFTASDRDVLHSWASDYRGGIAAVRPSSDQSSDNRFDNNTIMLPANTRKSKFLKIMSF